jgi:hypothetical protein
VPNIKGLEALCVGVSANHAVWTQAHKVWVRTGVAASAGTPSSPVVGGVQDVCNKLFMRISTTGSRPTLMSTTTKDALQPLTKSPKTLRPPRSCSELCCVNLTHCFVNPTHPKEHFEQQKQPPCLSALFEQYAPKTQNSRHSNPAALHSTKEQRHALHAHGVCDMQAHSSQQCWGQASTESQPVCNSGSVLARLTAAQLHGSTPVPADTRTHDPTSSRPSRPPALPHS